ncbi:2OG-Fe(II) oxygenase [Hyphomicrobium sp. 1Nfss2.1]|uniref:2OG-Fe(II) oxygenase n=1 Tax=Hyphomicrobium sp. 1Nfss2.1 TaxID=3413936 RepID=UPI003C7DC756
MSASAKEVAASLLRSFHTASEGRSPYRHWFLKDCLPQSTVDEILSLPISAADLGGVSGKRELHNASRHYFDVANRAEHGCAESVSSALQDPRVAAEIERIFGVKLGGTYLRIEFAQDVDGFWLEPHTDIGVKAFTFLLYLSTDPTHADLGTDIYDNDKQWVGRSPFASNAAMIFVPSTISYHGFEPRKINGVRKSLVINYVTNEWRAREQLSYPEQPVMVAEPAFA